MKRFFGHSMLLLAVTTSIASVHASTLLHVDFSNDPVGQVPASAVYVVPATPSEPTGGTKVVVVDDSSVFPDPFGGSGNRSLMVDKLVAEEQVDPKAVWAYGYAPNTKVSFDVFTVKQGPLDSPMFHVFLTDSIWASTVPIGFLVDINNNVTLWGAQTRSILNVWTHNQANTVSISYGESWTYSVSINGQLLQDENGISVFGMGGAPSQLGYVQFATAWTGAQNSRFFVDEITVAAIPEPSTAVMVGLVGFAGVLAGLRRKFPIC